MKTDIQNVLDNLTIEVNKKSLIDLAQSLRAQIPDKSTKIIYNIPTGILTCGNLEIWFDDNWELKIETVDGSSIGREEIQTIGFISSYLEGGSHVL